MSELPLVFLDANVLFSAALGGEAFGLLFELARDSAVLLATSRNCVVEARTSLERKRPHALDELPGLLELVAMHDDVEDDEHTAWAAELVHPDDVHVLAAARRSGAAVLVTGDSTHFGALMERNDLGLRVRAPRAFLLEGP